MSVGSVRAIHRVCLALACALAVVFAAGCGGSESSEEQVQATLLRFAAAVAQRDYRELCTQLLASNLTARLTQIGLPCEQAMSRGFGRAQHPRLRVRSVRVRGSRASALVYTTASNQASSEDTIGLVKVRGDWRITSLGSGS